MNCLTLSLLFCVLLYPQLNNGQKVIPIKGKCPKLKSTIDKSKLSANVHMYLYSVWSDSTKPAKICEIVDYPPRTLRGMLGTQNKVLMFLLATDDVNFVTHFVCYESKEISFMSINTYTVEPPIPSSASKAIAKAYEKNGFSTKQMHILCK